MSGSMGGCTASHNRGGMYFRNRVVPTDPNTPRQASIRSYMAAAINAWTVFLTPAQRAAWETFAANTPMTDTLGSVLMLTGQQAFVKANVLAYTLARPTIVAAPTTFNNGQPVAVVQPTTLATPNKIGIATATGALLTSVLLMEDAPDDGDVAMYLGPPVNASRNFWKGPYQLAATTPIASGAGGAAFTTTAALQTQDDPLVVGQFRPVRFRVLYDDGRMSQVYRTIAEVVDDTV